MKIYKSDCWIFVNSAKRSSGQAIKWGRCITVNLEGGSLLNTMYGGKASGSSQIGLLRVLSNLIGSA